MSLNELDELKAQFKKERYNNKILITKMKKIEKN